ncbi:MAG: DUF559 domain-containing protein [Bacteroidota bacterium]
MTKREMIATAKELCRRLRRNPTRSEEMFWKEVRDRKVRRKKFYRQHPIFSTVVIN